MRVEGVGCRVWGLRVQGVGCGEGVGVSLLVRGRVARGLFLMSEVPLLGCRVWPARARGRRSASGGAGCRVWGVGCRV